MSHLRTRGIFESTTLSLVAVERIEIDHHAPMMGHFVYGSITAIAVIVRSKGGIFALDTSGNSMDIEQLERDLDESGASIR